MHFSSFLFKKIDKENIVSASFDEAIKSNEINSYNLIGGKEKGYGEVFLENGANKGNTVYIDYDKDMLVTQISIFLKCLDVSSKKPVKIYVDGKLNFKTPASVDSEIYSIIELKGEQLNKGMHNA